MNVDAVCGEGRCDSVAKRRGLAREQMVRTFDDGDRRAHAGQRLAELEADGATAEDQQPARHPA